MSPNSALLDSSSSSPATRRRRAQIACRNCRKRKIKCVTNEEPPHNPCERCQRKGLLCEYVAVGEPSPPSTPALEGPGHGEQVPLESQAYTYGNNPHFPNPTYSAGYHNPSQMTVGYPPYSNMDPLNNPAHLNASRFSSDPHTSWYPPNPNSGMLPSQVEPLANKSYYAQNSDYLGSPNASQWSQTQDPMHPKYPNAYDNRLQYYSHMPASNPQQHNILYGSQSYDSSNSCWCRATPCVCGGRR